MAPAGLEPRSETPRNVGPLPAGATLAPEPAERPDGAEAAPGENGGAEGVVAGDTVDEELPDENVGAADSARESAAAGAKPGAETCCADVVGTTFAAGAPAGCQPADEEEGGVE